MPTRSPSPHLFLVVANLLRIDQLDFSFPVTNEFMLSGTFRKKFAIPILPEQFGMGGTVAVNFFWYIWVADQLPGQGGVAVVFLSLLALIFVWQGSWCWLEPMAFLGERMFLVLKFLLSLYWVQMSAEGAVRVYSRTQSFVFIAWNQFWTYLYCAHQVQALCDIVVGSDALSLPLLHLLEAHTSKGCLFFLSTLFLLRLLWFSIKGTWLKLFWGTLDRSVRQNV